MQEIVRNVPKHVQWGILAGYLLKTKKKLESSPRGYRFSTAVSRMAENLGLAGSSLWGYFTAGQYYNELRSKYAQRGKIFPDLDSGKAPGYPDLFLTLRKIARTEPANLEEMELLVLGNRTSREEMRALWKFYRPLLDGRTKRGRNAIAPHIDGHDTKHLHARRRVEVLHSFRKAGARWTGSEHPYVYELLVLDASALADPRGPHAYLAHCSASDSALRVHPLLIMIEAEGNTKRETGLHMAEIDGAWTLFPKEVSDPACLALARKGSGILKLTSTGVRVLRGADHTASDTDREAALRALLLHTLRSQSSDHNRSI